MALLVDEVRRYSILIADDDAACRDALRELIEPEGYQTVLAGSGEEALEIVERKPVHLLLCDQYMPRLTGLETVQLVHQFNAVLPCILVTSDVTEQLMRQALLVKTFSVLAKPVSKNLLLYTVMRALVKTYHSNQ